MNVTRTGLGLLAMAAATAAFAAPAAADSQSFIDEVHYDIVMPYDKGVENGMVSMGNAVCVSFDAAVAARIEPGVAVMKAFNIMVDAMDEFPPANARNVAATTIVSAVQELCPRHAEFLAEAMS